MRTIFVYFGRAVVDESSLFQLFAARLRVKAAKVVRDDEGHSRGYGFVMLDSEADYDAALEMNGERAFGGQVLRVQPGKERFS